MDQAPDIVIAYSGPVQSGEIEKRLKSAGISVRTQTETDEEPKPPVALLVELGNLDIGSLDRVTRGLAPVLFVVPEDYQPPAWSLDCPDALVHTPLRGREFENAVQLVLHRAQCGMQAALIGSVRDYALFMVDLEGVVISWNPGGKAAFGYTANQILGKPLSLFYTQEDRSVNVPETELRMAATE